MLIRYLAEALADMAVELEYERPAPISRSPVLRLGVALAVSLLAHLLLLRFYVGFPIKYMENDVRFNKCVAISLGYWVVVLLMVARRRLRATFGDLAVIAVAYPLAVLICHVATDHGL